jgi:hypothetical protein
MVHSVCLVVTTERASPTSYKRSPRDRPQLATAARDLAPSLPTCRRLGTTDPAVDVLGLSNGCFLYARGSQERRRELRPLAYKVDRWPLHVPQLC